MARRRRLKFSKEGITQHFRREGRLMLWLVVGIPLVLTFGSVLVAHIVFAGFGS